MSFNKIDRLIFGVLIISLCIIGLVGDRSAAATISEEFVLVKQNQQLALYARPSDGQVIIQDLPSGKLWRSNPDVSEISGFMMLSDVWQGNLQSPVYLEYFDKRRNVRGANAHYGDPEIEFNLTDQGFNVSYFFPTSEIGCNVEFTLAEDSLLVTIPWDSVTVGNEDLQLLSIRLLPFLGAQPSSTEYDGYMVVPDGSGGLVHFKELVSLSQTGFNQWIYGLDPGSAEPSYDPYRQPVVLPVFGIQSMDQALLGIVEQGQEAAKILATPAGVITDYNWITAEFWYSQSIIMRTSRQGSGIRIFDENPIPGDRSVRFYFLTSESANYVEMAKIYRDYLIKHQGAQRLDLSQWPAPLMIELLGADFETNIFGPVIQPMTTFEQGKMIVDTLVELGVDQFVVNFNGWNRMGVNGSLPRRFPAEQKLGGDQALSELASYLADIDISLLLQDDYTLARGSRTGFQPSTQASRTTFNDIIKYETSSYLLGGTSLTTYLINPEISLEYAARDIPKIAEYGVAGLTHKALGENLNSDHNPNREIQIQRHQTKIIYQDLLNITSEQLTYVGATQGNAYVIGLVDYLTDVPMETTRDTFIDQRIPFFQIATHGLVTYYGQPINLSTNPTRSLLRSVEYGALPYFILTAQPSHNLRYTLSSDMYSTYYLDWLDDILYQYQQVNENMLAVHDQFITDHRQLAPNVFLTEYENGIAYLVNYGNQSYSYGDIIVPSNSFTVIEKEELK